MGDRLLVWFYNFLIRLEKLIKDVRERLEEKRMEIALDALNRLNEEIHKGDKQ